jgi:hypothetical protein
VNIHVRKHPTPRNIHQLVHAADIMTVFNLAFTAPINPEGATPVLSQSQVWSGLQRKVRRAYEFVPIITACEVVSETTNPEGNLTIVRKATFKKEVHGGKGTYDAQEECVLYEPTRVDFKQPDGTIIYNTVSKGHNGELYMTYTFEWRRPDITEGSEEATNLQDHYNKVSLSPLVTSYHKSPPKEGGREMKRKGKGR